MSVLTRRWPNTVEPPNKVHVGDNVNSLVLSFVEKLSSSRRFKTMERLNIWDLKQCPCRVVYYTLSLSWRVHYRRFHCTDNIPIHAWHSPLSGIVYACPPILLTQHSLAVISLLSGEHFSVVLHSTIRSSPEQLITNSDI